MKKAYCYLNEKVRNKDPLILCSILFLMALALRIYILCQPQIISNDALFYVMLAKSIASGNFEHLSSFDFFSIHPFLIVLSQTIIPDWETAGRVVSLICGSCAVIPLFLLFATIFDKKIAFTIGLLYVFGPRFVEYSTDILRESPFWLFSISTLYFAAKGIDGRKVFYIFIASLLVVLSFMTRIEGLSLFPVIGLWISYAFIVKDLSWRTALFFLAMFLLAIPLLTFSALLFVDHGAWSWVVLKISEKVSLLLKNGSAHLITSISADVLRQIPSGPKLFLELAEDYKYLLFSSEIVYKTFKSMTIIPVLLLLAGVFMRKTITFSKKEVYLLIWIGVFFVVSVYYMRGTYYFGTRHGLLLGIPTLLWAAIGFIELKDRFVKFAKNLNVANRTGRIALFIIPWVAFLALFCQILATSAKDDKLELKKAGIVLKNMGFSNTTFILQPTLNRIAFYADAGSVPLSDKIDNNNMKVLVKQRQATLLIIDERTINDYVPGIRKIIEQSTFEKLTVPEMDQYREYSFSIYKIR
jgi:hypothetical protein